MATSGSARVGPYSQGSHTFTISCAGPGGSASETARLTVTAAADPDTDGDGTVDSIDTDDDNDGMPDACEIRYGFNPLDASDGGSTNTDGDGASNAHECKHGTDPTRMLQPLRAEDAVLTPGTRQAEVISRTLGAYLDAPVLSNRLLGVGNGILPQVADPDDYDGDIAKVLESMEFVRDKITLLAPQNQVTDAEREDSPNKDVTDGLLRCTHNVPCYPDDYTPRQRLGINSRLEELLLPLASATYSSTDEAAIAIHDSPLHMFARELGIEVLVTIDDMVNPVKITNVSTSFYTEFVGVPSDSYGKSIWHNHPGPYGVWQGDAASYVNGFGSDICNQERDFIVYASISSLSKANVKQVIGIADKSSFKFSASIYSKEDSIWESRTYDFRDDADEVDVSCSSN